MVLTAALQIFSFQLLCRLCRACFTIFREYVDNANEPPRRHCGWFGQCKYSKFWLPTFGVCGLRLPICVKYILPLFSAGGSVGGKHGQSADLSRLLTTLAEESTSTVSPALTTCGFGKASTPCPSRRRHGWLCLAAEWSLGVSARDGIPAACKRQLDPLLV